MVCGVGGTVLAESSAPPADVRQLGSVAFSVDHWPRLLEDWWAACLCVPADRMFTVEDQPFRYGDQDALNALLMSEVDAESIAVLPRWGVSIPHERQPTVIDQNTLACMRDGGRVSILHHYGRPKVWSRTGRQRLRLSRNLCPSLPASGLWTRRRTETGFGRSAMVASSRLSAQIRLGVSPRSRLAWSRKADRDRAVRGTGRRVQRATGRLRAEP